MERLVRVEDTIPSFATPLIGCQSRKDTLRIPERLCDLPPLNAIANQALALSASPDVDLKRLAGVIECDPAFGADVLFLANSSLFGFRSRIQVLRHAIAVLGLDRIKSLAVTVAIRGFLGKGGPLLRQCWQHSAACALIAQEISPIFQITGDTAYTVGLVHDIGRLGLLKTFPVEYAAILNSPFQDAEEVLRAERAVLNVDHNLAGAWLVTSWGLPPVFVSACEHHHDWLSPYDPELLQVVKASCLLAEALGFSAVKYVQPFSYGEVVESFPPHIRPDAFPPEAELKDRIEARIKSFE